MPEALIIDALQTPLGRYRGVLAGVRPDDLAAHTIVTAVERTGIDPKRSTTSTGAPRTRRARTTATWHEWRDSWPGFPSRCPGSR